MLSRAGAIGALQSLPPSLASNLEAAQRDKIVAAEKPVAIIRLGIVLFGIVIYSLQDQTGTLPWLAYTVLAIAGAYGVIVYYFEPYRRFPILLSSYFTSISDACLISLWLLATGGIFSSYYVIVYAAIISIAFRYNFRETMLAAALYSFGYVLVTVAMGQVHNYSTDMVVRLAYFFFVGALGGLFARESLDQIRAKLELRDLTHDLALETEERRQAQAALVRYAAELEQRVAEATADLREAKEQVEAILNSSSDAIALARLDGTLITLNPAFQALLGQAQAAAPNLHLEDLIDAEHAARLTEILQVVTEDRRPSRFEASFYRPDGSRFDADIAVAPLVEQGSNDVHVVYSLRDITTRKQAEENLRRALEHERELNELKARFTSMVSHEFRTPLASIHTSADLLTRYTHRLSEESKREHGERIKKQVKQLTGLLDDILTLSRAESVELQMNRGALELDHLCREIVGEMQLIARNHVIHLQVHGQPQLAYIDGNLVRQAVTNILSNAVKYSPPGKDVSVELHYTESSAIIRVRDEGIGIPEEDQKRLFEVFHRASNVGATPGTGLGLAIVKQAVEAHDGTVEVESKVGEGTCFTITLPLQAARTDQAAV